LETFGQQFQIKDKNGTVLPFHQGRWVGNGLGLRTVWLPFTETFDSNSLQIIGIDKSREITRKSEQEKWTHERLEESLRSRMLSSKHVPW